MHYKVLFGICLLTGVLLCSSDLTGQYSEFPRDSIYRMYRNWDKKVFTLSMKDATELKAPLYKVKGDTLLLIPGISSDYKTFRELHDKMIVPVSLNDVLSIRHKGNSSALTGTLIGLFAGAFIGYATSKKEANDLAAVISAPASAVAGVTFGGLLGALVGLAVGSSIQKNISLYPAKNPEAVKEKLRKEAFYTY